MQRFLYSTIPSFNTINILSEHLTISHCRSLQNLWNSRLTFRFVPCGGRPNSVRISEIPCSAGKSLLKCKSGQSSRYAGFDVQFVSKQLSMFTYIIYTIMFVLGQEAGRISQMSCLWLFIWILPFCICLYQIGKDLNEYSKCFCVVPFPGIQI